MTSVTSFEYEFDWYFPDSMNMDRNVIFVWQDGRNWYGLKINQNTMFVQKVVNGASHAFENDAINYPFAINRRYHFKVTFNADHTIQVDIDGQRVWSSVDYKPYITGFKTLGLQASVGGAPYSRSYFDNLVVRDTSSPEKLSVPLLKQTDPAWTDIVYDSAQNWASNTGIGRWGCAITSLTMIMQYHGLVQMPDGTPVTPAAINAWLNSQSDGYIGEGLVNWVATTRLTRLISEQYGTPKLEYARRNTAELTSTYEQIAMGLPVMLQIPGHFIVATGAQQDPQDLFINDPAYSYTKLSQHAQQPISARFFTPSHTDLSYLLIHHALELQLEITFPDSNQFDNAYAEYIKDQTEGATEQKSSLFMKWKNRLMENIRSHSPNQPLVHTK
jgi:hypothetical protein